MKKVFLNSINIIFQKNRDQPKKVHFQMTKFDPFNYYFFKFFSLSAKMKRTLMDYLHAFLMHRCELHA